VVYNGKSSFISKILMNDWSKDPVLKSRQSAWIFTVTCEGNAKMRRLRFVERIKVSVFAKCSSLKCFEMGMKNSFFVCVDTGTGTLTS
jgi:hypothetical protein